MITIEQEKQIIDYLTDKKLPLDILLELQDHMILQISEFQNNEKLNFDDAFLKVQGIWEEELKMTMYFGLYFGEIPVIGKKIMRGKFNVILKNSLLLVLASFVFNILLVYISGNKENYKILFQLYTSLFLIVPLIIQVFNYKIGNYTASHKKYKGKLFYTIFQKNIGILITGFIFLPNMVINQADKTSGYFFQFFTTFTLSTNMLIACIATFVIQYVMIFGILNFFEHKKSLEKIKNFLSVSR